MRGRAVDQPVPVVVADLVAEVAEQRAVGLAHLRRASSRGTASSASAMLMVMSPSLCPVKTWRAGCRRPGSRTPARRPGSSALARRAAPAPAVCRAGAAWRSRACARPPWRPRRRQVRDHVVEAAGAAVAVGAVVGRDGPVADGVLRELRAQAVARPRPPTRAPDDGPVRRLRGFRLDGSDDAPVGQKRQRATATRAADALEVDHLLAAVTAEDLHVSGLQSNHEWIFGASACRAPARAHDRFKGLLPVGGAAAKTPRPPAQPPTPQARPATTPNRPATRGRRRGHHRRSKYVKFDDITTSRSKRTASRCTKSSR